jgi:hypothetical protein
MPQYLPSRLHFGVASRADRISRFAREIGALEGQVRYDEVVATQFAALWKGKTSAAFHQ